jgi:AcrR family transcriptional regulator
MAQTQSIEAGGGTRAHILDTAYRLFARDGIRAVGVDRIAAESGVAKMTLYRHYPSKDDLVLAFLELRQERWTRDWLQAEVERLDLPPRERLLALFDALDQWFRRRDFEGCSFINTLLEVHHGDDPIRRETISHLEGIRGLIEDYAKQAGLARPEETAYHLQILMMGAVVSASRGDRDAACRARQVAELLLENA